MNTNTQVQPEAAQIVMISIECSMFGGYKRSSEQDIIDAGGKVPDTDILTKGGKHIFPSERLATFGTVKKNVFRDLWKFGIKALGSGSVIAITAEDLPEAERTLEEASTEFAVLLNDLKANYDTWLEEFIQEQPVSSGEIIRRAALTMEDATSRFKFNYDFFMPTPIGKNGSVESMVSKLTSQLYKEVAQAAYDTYNISFNPLVKDGDGARARRKVGQKAKSPLRNCRDKLAKLSRLHPDIPGAVTIIESVLASTQVTGWIEDTPSNPCDSRLYGLVQLMMNAVKFSNAATKIMQSVNVDADIDALCGIVVATENLFDDSTEDVADIVVQPSVVADIVVEQVQAPVVEPVAAPLTVEPVAVLVKPVVIPVAAPVKPVVARVVVPDVAPSIVRKSAVQQFESNFF